MAARTGVAQPPATEPRRGPAWSKLSAPTLRADRHHSPRPGPHWGGRSLCSRQEQRLEFFLVIQTNCKHFYSFLGPYINSCGAASAPGRRPAVHGGARRPAPARSLTPLCRRSPLCSPLAHESSVPALAPRPSGQARPLGQTIRQGGGSIPKRPLLEDRQRLR